MKKFNLEKQAKITGYKNYNNMLGESNKQMDLSSPDTNTEVNLEINPLSSRKKSDNELLYEGQLNKSRTKLQEATIAETSLNDSPKVYNDKRLDIWDTPITVTNLLSEAYDQKKEESLKEAESEQKRNTEFWDKYVGLQMEGPETTIINNVQKSQLENEPSRFRKMDKIEPIGSELINKDKFYKMVTASLKDADAMLFHIYSIACKEGRNLSSEEKQQITDINSGKTRLIAQYGDNSTLMPTQIFDGDVFIIPNKYGKWLVYETGGGGEPIDEFDSAKEALTNYPEGEIRNA